MEGPLISTERLDDAVTMLEGCYVLRDTGKLCVGCKRALRDLILSTKAYDRPKDLGA